MTSMLMPEIALVPPLLSTDIRLFDYQNKAIDATRNEFKKGVRSTLVVMATGLGKTYLSGFVGRGLVANGKRFLFLIHTDELANQTVDKFHRCGLWPSLEKAGSYARSMYSEPNCVVASRQTMKGDRLESWPRDYFWLIICDESHHSTSPQYKNIFKHFSSARRLLITATPNRTDGVALLGNVCETKAFEMNLLDALTAPPPGPYLTKPIFRQVDMEVDLRGMKKRKGDFNEAELDTIIKPQVEILANAIRDRIGDRRAIVFMPGVQSGLAMAAALRNENIGLSAKSVWGDDPDREMKIQDFKNGEYQILCNCQMLTEGVDFPDVSCIVLCRPTKSVTLATQMVGRGTRLYPGKADCLILDFSWVTEEHDLISPVEILAGGKYSDAAIGRAKSGIRDRKEQEIDLLEAVASADREISFRQEFELEVKRKHVKAKRDLTFDPIARAMNALGLTPRNALKEWAAPATEKQLAVLKKNGFRGLDRIDKETASEMVSKVMEINNVYKEKNLPSISQRRLLMSQGYAAARVDSMSRNEATEIVGSLMAKFAAKKRA